MLPFRTYLQNPKKYDPEAKNTDRTQTFFMPKRAAIRQEIKKIIEKISTVEEDEMYAGDVFENTSIAGTSITVTDTASTITLQEELEKQLQQEKNIFKTRPDNKQKDYEKNLKKEMACFESDGIRGEYLTLAYEYIMTVQPISVETERAFSASGYIYQPTNKMIKQLIIIAGMCVVLNYALPPVVTLGWQGAARTPITIVKLAMNFVTWSTPCDVSRAPNDRSFSNDQECINRCPGYCASLMNCNATCVLGNRCVCAASRYCFINWNKTNPDGTYVFDDCYDFDKQIP
uniref:HAT C-terminal dimerisation domain-containing protein n=1 Tax=Heliothis virescens TaxID=7102 RepID=A0A2A4JJD4_HELVI